MHSNNCCKPGHTNVHDDSNTHYYVLESIVSEMFKNPNTVVDARFLGTILERLHQAKC